MIELWLVDLDASAAALRALERQCPRLRPADRTHASRHQNVRERQRRLAAYTALRLVLERTAGRQARALDILREGAGKPRLAGNAAKFSLSHAGEMALIGISTGADIGVDLEASRSVRISQARRAAIEAAAAGLAGASVRALDGDAAFLQAWCRLEAYAKASGQGLAGTLTALNLRGGAKQASAATLISIARQAARAAELRVADLDMPDGLHGAVALAGRPKSPRVKPFPADVVELARFVRNEAC
jgi:4'-phosphopantetheinyl transferase